MEKLTDTMLKKSLAAGIRRLYLVAGNDAFLVNSCVSLIANAALDSADNPLRFTQKTLTDGVFEEVFYNFSLLGGHRVAIVEDFSASSLTAPASELLKELLPVIPNDLVIILRQISDDRRFTVSKKTLDMAALCPDGAVVLANAKTGQELGRYIENIARREHCVMEPPAARALATLCGDDLLLISGEIKKLAALCDYGTVTLAHVEALGIRTAEAGVYKLIGAVEAGRTREALAELEDMLDNLSEPLAITAVLNTAFVNLYRARVARDRGRPIQFLYDNFDYKKGDRRVAIAYERSTKYNREQLERMIGLLFYLDLRLKSSIVDSKTIIEQTVVALCAEAGI